MPRRRPDSAARPPLRTAHRISFAPGLRLRNSCTASGPQRISITPIQCARSRAIHVILVTTPADPSPGSVTVKGGQHCVLPYSSAFRRAGCCCEGCGHVQNTWSIAPGYRYGSFQPASAGAANCGRNTSDVAAGRLEDAPAIDGRMPSLRFPGWRRADIRCSTMVQVDQTQIGISGGVHYRWTARIGIPMSGACRGKGDAGGS